MKELKFTFAEVMLLAGTRVALGVGLGLTRLDDDQRKAAGCALAFVGAITTVPLAMEIFRKNNADETT
jgi:hypothetical protein